MSLRSNGQMVGLYKTAILLSQITVFYNLLEGLVSVFLGLEDETLSLLGFGIDSFVEVISGIGIWHMVYRMKRDLAGDVDPFERTALQITGGAFYLLALALILTAVSQSLSWSSSGNDFLGDRYFPRIDCHDGVSDQLQDACWKAASVGCHHRRCQLHQDLFVPVFRAAVGERRLCRYRNRRARLSRCRRYCRFCLQGRKGSV